jgi:putative methyltransferase
MKKAEAKEYLEREGWRLIENTFKNYYEFIEAVKNLDDESYLVDFNIKNLYVFPPSSKKYWASNEYAAEGKFLLQDKASCLPSFLLNPSPKSTVLDMCSAPGNKSSHLAAIMKNKGKIYSVEMNAKRYNLLLETLEGTKSTIVQAMNNDVLQITNDDTPNVEYILLDPSCSGSGIANRFSSDTAKDKDRLFRLAGLQFKLLSHAMTSFPNVKRIIYSTCSIYPEENEEVVQSALSRIGDFKLIDIKEHLPEGKWKSFGNEKVYPDLGDKVLYARTEDDLTNGFFVAILERCEEGEFNEFYLRKQQSISVHKDKEGTKGGKRKAVEVEEECEEPTEMQEVKKKKKWKNKLYQ